MLKNILILIALQALLTIELSQAQCSTRFGCLHSGSFNNRTCKCDCMPAYSGNYCEVANCSSQPSLCGVVFTKDMCTVPQIQSYCPAYCNAVSCRCGNDQCLNNGTYNARSCSCQCPPGYIGNVCQTFSNCSTILTCQNNGVFNPLKCTCDCFGSYSGDRCQNLVCNTADPAMCINFRPIDCAVVSILNSYCPIMCSRCSANCGVQAIKPNLDLKIVGGSVAVPNSWPWQAALLTVDGDLICSATIINSQWLLTSAQCNWPLDDLVVSLGSHDISTFTNGQTSNNASQFILHPDFDAGDIVNDIALIKLTTEIKFTNTSSPVCLPAGKTPVVGTNAIVTGWGTVQADGKGDISSLLKQVHVPILDPLTAPTAYGPILPTQIYSGFVNVTNPGDFCDGDQGAGLVQKDPSTGFYYIAGIASFNILCGGNGIYTNVVQYENWIKTTILAK